MKLENAIVIIVGFGRSGMSTASFLEKQKSKIIIIDETIKEKEIKKVKRCLFITAGIPAFLRIEPNLIVVSPGIPAERGFLRKKYRVHMPVISEIDIAFLFSKNVKIIGVTGTNGKSTTVKLIGNILQALNKKVIVGGNIGVPLINYEIHNKETRNIILELSSYQLETISKLKLDVGVVTNFSIDHSERYSSKKHYFETKIKILNLIKKNGTIVVNKKCKRLLLRECKKIKVRLKKNKTQEDKKYIKNFDKKKHVVENVLFTYHAVSSLNSNKRNFLNLITKINSAPHRIEFLQKLNGALIYNDSKSTNIESTKNALINTKGSATLVMGGKGKGASYLPIIKYGKSKIKKIYSVGRETGNIFSSLNMFFLTKKIFFLKNILISVKKQKKTKENILLSPGCSSLDQFKSFKHRGNYIKYLLGRISDLQT